ncbi:MAG: hypothetical protein ACFFCW_25595 [Candidatus Hodarchaeota archaeon]
MDSPTGDGWDGQGSCLTDLGTTVGREHCPLQESLVEGAFDYLAKPYDMDLLASKITDAYERGSGWCDS